MSTLGVARRNADDDEEIFRLYEEVFGEGLTEASRRRWRWQYLENPETGSSGPDIWVVREEGRLLGQYASMPVRLWWGQEEVRASWGMDVFVRAEARGKGAGARLFTTWADQVEVALGLGLTPSSYGLFQKLRYHDVGPVPFYQRILDPRAVVRRRWGPSGALLGPLLGSALSLWRPDREPPPGNTTISPITHFGPEYDRLWERARASYAMCVRRDAAYLDWKYARCPHRRYQLWEAKRQGDLVGFAVSRWEDYEGLRLGWIVDLFADASDGETRHALIGRVIEEFRNAGVARAQAFSMNKALAVDLNRRGFIKGRSPMQFCVKAHAEGPMARPELWHVVFGDSDMDR